MAFSWKKAKRDNIRSLKKRKQIQLNNGETTNAKDTDYDIKKVENNGL